MTTNVVERGAAPSTFEEHVRRMGGAEPTLTDISSVLYQIGNADEVDGVRIQALCLLASRALGKFDADTRTAPPAALAEVVRDARANCGNAHQGCTEYVLPWTYNGRHCGPTCEHEDGRTRP